MTKAETHSSTTTKFLSEGAHETTVASTIEYLMIEDIIPSKSNLRKTFTEIDDLAKDLERHGMLQPLLVRPSKNERASETYELVFGERRWRAAKRAKLATVPAMVRELDDEKVLELQIVENSQRADLHPLEEAEGYETFHTKFGITVDDICAKIGRPRAHVYARMKLLALCPEARKAFYAGTLNPSTALYLARIPHADLQIEALKRIAECAKQRGEPMSAREVQEMVGRCFMLKLADAPFPTADAHLVEKAGACATCPKRTGNQRELFSDVKSADVCTDPVCWEEKRVAGTAKTAKVLEAEGVKVVVGEVHRDEWSGPRIDPPRGYVKVQGYDNELHANVADVVKNMAKKPPIAVMFDSKGGPVEIVRKKDLPKKAPNLRTSSHAGANDKLWRQRERERGARNKAQAKLEDEVVAFVKKGIAADKAWRLIGLEVEPCGLKSRPYLKLKGSALIGEVFRMAIKGSPRSEPSDATTLLGALLVEAKIDWKGVVAAEVAKVTPKKKARRG